MDTAPEEAFDDLTGMAAYFCAAPTALVSLVDVERQWFKSRVGLEADETPRNVAFCAHTILQPELFIVTDAARDARFADNPLVTGAPHIRFYAGMPLVTPSGHALGTLCVIDYLPRDLDDKQRAQLRALARQVVLLLELRRRTSSLKQTNQELQQALAKQRQSKDVLQQSEEKYRTILESIEEGYFEADLAGNLTFCSTPLCRIVGYEREELLGMNYRQWTDAENAALVYAAFNRVYTTGEPVKDFTYRFRRKDGAILTWENSITLIRDAVGRPAGFRGFTRDVTQRKRAEETLLAGEERFKSFMDNSPAVAFTKDSQGRYVYLNRPFERLFNITLEDMRGKTDFEVWPEETARQLRANDLSVLAAGQTVELVET
ncbi:MAG: PAS domain S-box protein, partial [Pyrinomonadaceae bacterium]